MKKIFYFFTVTLSILFLSSCVSKNPMSENKSDMTKSAEASKKKTDEGLRPIDLETFEKNKPK